MGKIKQCIESDKGKDILIIIIIILVGLGSFSLGRLSKNIPNEGIKIEYDNQSANALESIFKNEKEIPELNSKNFFASNRGSKYYSLGCSGGKTVKQENRVYFKTSEEAEKAGYELSSLCK